VLSSQSLAAEASAWSMSAPELSASDTAYRFTRADTYLRCRHCKTQAHIVDARLCMYMEPVGLAFVAMGCVGVETVASNNALVFVCTNAHVHSSLSIGQGTKVRLAPTVLSVF
jgi:hypothetical protein